MGIITTQNVVNPRRVSVPLNRINSNLNRRSLVTAHPHHKSSMISHFLPHRHQLFQEGLLTFPLLSGQWATSRMELLSSCASRCLKCSQLKSYDFYISFSNSLFILRISSCPRPLALGSSSFLNTRMSSVYSTLHQYSIH